VREATRRKNRAERGQKRVVREVRVGLQGGGKVGRTIARRFTVTFLT
jgi:hypothetical protein